MVMANNLKTREQVQNEMEMFLDDKAEIFVHWSVRIELLSQRRRVRASAYRGPSLPLCLPVSE